MPRCRHFLPGFRATCVGVGATFALLAGSQLAKGTHAAMEGFGIPEIVLASPHYLDAMTWVFFHMFVIGVITATVGFVVESPRARVAFARVMLAAVAVYTWMDVRASDSALGNHLYAGPRSLVPPVIDVIVLVLFAHLAFCRRATDDAT